MNISKTILMLSLAALCISCTEQGQDGGNIEISSESTLTPFIASAGGTAVIEFTADCDWTANVPDISSYSWSSITPTSGGAGTNAITVTALRNDTYDDRSFTFDIKAGGEILTATVTQRQKNALTVTPGSFEMPEEGGELRIEVVANIEYTYSVDCDWIVSSPASKALETTELLFDVLPADDFENARTGHIVISSGEDLNETITVTQAPKTRVFEVPVTELSVPMEGGEVSFTVNANFAYSVTMDDCDWVSAASDISGEFTGENTFVFNVQTQDGIKPRSVNVNITTGVADYSAVVTISQSGLSLNCSEYWHKSYLTDLTSISNAGPMRLAWAGDYLIVSDGSSVHLLDRGTGAYVSSLNLPDGITVRSLTTDDAGNVVFATEAAYPDGVLNVYTVSLLDPQTPELVLSYNHNSIYSTALGNIRVVGNVKDKAVVTGICSGGTSYWIAWQIENGVAQTPVFGAGLGNIWGTNQCGISAVSDDLSDGILRIGYSGSYDLEYCSDVTANTWTTVFETASSWAENYGSLSVKEFNDRRICAIGRGVYVDPGSGGLIGAYVVDITDLSDAFALMDVGSSYTGASFASVTDNSNDVLLVDDGDVLSFYLTDNAGDYLLGMELTF